MARPTDKGTYVKTLDLLEAELNRVAARNVVISVDTELSQIRNDGWLRTDARLKSPGVILTFNKPNGSTLTFPCDRFVAWHDNLRAIALTLEALRMIDRFGVTANNQQYRGFLKALPAPEESEQKLTPQQAADFIASKVSGVSAGALLSDAQLFATLVKLAKTRLHPDVAGGDGEDFRKLGEAEEALTEWFAGKKETATGGQSS